MVVVVGVFLVVKGKRGRGDVGDYSLLGEVKDQVEVIV